MRTIRGTRRADPTRRRGVVVYIALFVIAVLGVTIYALYLRMQSENARIHRAYYSTTALKLAEACEAEAFAWLAAQMELPWRSQHPFLQQLYTEPTEDFSVTSGEEPADPDHRYLDLLQADALLNSAALGEALRGRAEILRATLVLMDFQPIQVPDEGDFDASSQARAVVDPFERFGTAQFEVHVGYGKVMRGPLTGQNLVKKYTSRRDIKVVNVLAPVVSRFTLFARGFTDPKGRDEPFNTDSSGGNKHRAWVGTSDFGRSQPLILVHHPDDIKEKQGYSPTHKAIADYQPYEEPFDNLTLNTQVLADAETPYRPDIQNRGWVYLGGEEPWTLNLQAGRANPLGFKRFKPDWAASMTQEGHLYHETFLTVTSDQLSVAPGMESWTPNLGSVHGWRFALWSNGIPSGLWGQDVYKNGIYGNFRRRPENKGMRDAPSLLRLYGDIQPFDVSDLGEPARYIDRRSPTLVLGPVLRRYSVIGQVMQMDLEDRTATDAGTFPFDADGVQIFPYREPRGGEPKPATLPYFHVTADGYDDSSSKFRFGGSWVWAEGDPPPDLNKIDETEVSENATRPADWTRMEWTQNGSVFSFDGERNWNVIGMLMSKIRTQHYHDGYDWLVENSHPTAVEPERHLKQANIRSIEPFEGEIEDRRFFYGAAEPDRDLCYFGRGLRFHQFDENLVPPENRPGDGSFPEGFFHGSLESVSLYDTSLAPPDPTTSARLSPERYDIRIKTTFSFADEAEFMATMIPGGDGVLKVSPGITVLRTGGLDLTRWPEVVFTRGGLILCDGPIRLPRVVKDEAARELGEVLTFVSMSSDIVVAGDLVEASLVALGEGRTLKKESDDLTIRGNLVVDVLDFSSKGTGLFARRGTGLEGTRPTGTAGLEAYPRNVIEYDPALNPAALDNYRSQYRGYMAGGISYWGVTE